MAKKASTPEVNSDEIRKYHDSFVVSNGRTIFATHGPADPNWDGKKVSLKAVIKSWTKPVPERTEASRADVAVWHKSKLVAVIREVNINVYDVIIFGDGA